MDDLDLGQTIRGFSAGQKLFGRYTLKAVLGRGGMGIVWLAFDEQLERDVALKFLPELIIHDRAVLEELKRETRRSLELTHHNIVRIHDFAQDSQSACISMEYVDGATLSSLRVDRAQRVFEAEELLPLIDQACDALSYAHDRGRIVHRDLKPANLMLNRKGELKVTDFGISRSLTDSISMMTMGRGTSGTLPYMSPQQLDGERTSHLDDIYSLGATIYDLLTSKPPFHSGNIDRQVHDKVPPPISERRAELEIAGQPIPERWEQTIARCLSKNPAQRPQSAAQVAASLNGHNVTAVVIPAQSSTPSPRQTPSRRNIVPLVVGALLLLLAGAGTAWYLGRAEPGRPQVAAQAVTDDAKQPAAPQQATPTPGELQSATTEATAMAKGAVIVKTEPAGAAITLGDKTDRSPASFSEILPGNHSIKVELAGYEPLQREIDVKVNAVATPGLITLQRSTGTVEIGSTPQGVDFVLVDADGKAHTGKTPQTLTKVPSGAAKITFESKGSSQQPAELEVLPNRVATYTGLLSPHSASPTPAVSPPDAVATKPSPAETPQTFAGTWKGRTKVRCSDGSSASGPVWIVVVARNEKTVKLLDGAGKTLDPGLPCRRKGNTLSWSSHGSAGDVYMSLTLNTASSAAFSVKAKCRESGTLTR